MFADFSFYSKTLNEVVFVEAEVEYNSPQPNNDASDWDNYGGFIIKALSMYSQGATNHPIELTDYSTRELLDFEARANLNKHMRELDTEDCFDDELGGF